MTPDQPITLVVTIFGSILALMLPVRWMIVPLVVSMFAYPTIVNCPPVQMQLSAQRIIGLCTLFRALATPAVREKFKWGLVDTVAAAYFVMLLLAQAMTAVDVVQAVTNRVGFFLSAGVPFFCARLLVTDRDHLNCLLKGMIWGAVPMVFLGLLQMRTGDSPFRVIMEQGSPELWVPIFKQWSEIRPFLGIDGFRSSAPFQQCIMFGWFFAILFTPATSLFWEKRKVFPWAFAWLLLPLGTISTVSAGPMMMAGMSFFIAALFPGRKFAKVGFAVVITGYLALTFFAKRSPMEIVASLGFDSSSSYYRVNLLDYVMGNKPSMKHPEWINPMGGHWVAGYGLIPPQFDDYHDLCIQWINLAVVYGMLGVAGFFGLVGACAWSLWKGARKAVSVEDQWLAWTLMATLVASLLAMQLVALFGEMLSIYHLFLALVANTAVIVGSGGGAMRRVGVLAEMDGRQVMLRYNLRPGQRLAVLRPSGNGKDERNKGPVVQEMP